MKRYFFGALLAGLLLLVSCGNASQPVCAHAFQDGILTTPPDCIHTGVQTIVCKKCGKAIASAIPATGEHTFTVSAVIREATCADGEAAYACTVCGEKKTDLIPAVREHIWEETIVKPATLDAEGVVKNVCKVCGTATEEQPLPKPDLTKLKAEWDEEWEHRFDFIEDKALRDSIEEFYGFYDPEKLTKWAAHLYDPATGGFYYADSSRDYAGFLPDMESTYQITNWIRNHGFLQAYRAGGASENDALRAFLGSDMCNAILNFYNSCEDESDGYFYHPQFGKSGNVMRKSRDLSWANVMFGWLGGKAKYPTALERLAASGEKPTVTSPAPSKTFLNDKDLARAYTENLIATSSFEGWSNTLQTQGTQFKAGGVLDTVLDVLDGVSDPKSGIWGVKSVTTPGATYVSNRDKEETAYSTFTLTYKIAILYNDGKRVIPHSAALTANAIATITSDLPSPRYTYIHNPWATLRCLRVNLTNYGSAEELAAFDKLVRDNAPAMLASLKAQFHYFSHEDSSVSFFRSVSAATIYGTPISLGLPEGDVNATNLSLGTLGAVCVTFGLDHTPAIFNYRHGELFQAEIAALTPVQKKAVVFEARTFDFENGTPGEGYASEGVSATSKPGDFTRFFLTEDPKNAANRCLKIQKISGAGTSLKFGLLDSMKMTDTLSLQIKFRMYFDGNLHMNPVSDYTGMQQVKFGSGANFFYMICFVLDDKDHPTGIRYADMAHTSSGRTVCQSKLFAFDTWYEFTLDFDIKGLDANQPVFNGVTVSVDGEPFYTSKNYYQNGYQSGDHTFVFENKDVTATFSPQMRCEGDIYLDDLRMKLGTPEGK